MAGGAIGVYGVDGEIVASSRFYDLAGKKNLGGNSNIEARNPKQNHQPRITRMARMDQSSSNIRL
jgi:hypothetical protein